MLLLHTIEVVWSVTLVWYWWAIHKAEMAQLNETAES